MSITNPNYISYVASRTNEWTSIVNTALGSLPTSDDLEAWFDKPTVSELKSEGVTDSQLTSAGIDPQDEDYEVSMSQVSSIPNFDPSSYLQKVNDLTDNYGNVVTDLLQTNLSNQVSNLNTEISTHNTATKSSINASVLVLTSGTGTINSTI